MEGSNEYSSAVFSEEFVKQYDEVVQHMLIAFQNLRTRIQSIPRTDREAEPDAEAEKYVISLSHSFVVD